MQNQENRPPQASSNQAGAETPTAISGAGFPVKNTFIHYGTPLRTTSVSSPPKTVPPNFAPEGILADVAPLAAPQMSPSAFAARAATAIPPETPTQRGIAPLRLFDFLPSPTMQQPAGMPQQVAPQMQSQPAPGVQVLAPTMMTSGGCCGSSTSAMPVNMWQQQATMPQVQAPGTAMGTGSYPAQQFSMDTNGAQSMLWLGPWNNGGPAVNAPSRPPPMLPGFNGSYACPPDGCISGGNGMALGGCGVGSSPNMVAMASAMFANMAMPSPPPLPQRQ